MKKSVKQIYILVHLIAAIIANPILTMLMAWLGLDTGRPDTQ